MKHDDDTASGASNEGRPAKAAYEPPELDLIGNVRDLLAGGAEGSTDDGAYGTYIP
jgi:hypothetical protein